jgi:hypothetical protein
VEGEELEGAEQGFAAVPENIFHAVLCQIHGVSPFVKCGDFIHRIAQFGMNVNRRLVERDF